MRIFQQFHSKLGDFWWYSILMFAAMRCGDVINAMVGLWLVPKYVSLEELGAVMPLMQFTAFIGFPMAVLMTVFSRYIALFKAQGEDGRAKSAVKWFIGIAVALNVASGLFAIFLMPHFFERIRVVKGSLGVLVLAAGLLGAISPVFSRALQGLKKFNTITVLNLLGAPIRLVVMLVALPFRALSGYMLGQCAPSAFGIGVSSWVLWKNLGKSVKSELFWKGCGREFLRYFLLVFLSLGIGSVSAFVMPLVIRQRLPEVDSAAYYMITRFAELATYASVTLAFVMFPMVSEAHAKGQKSLKLFLYTSAGSVGFGVLASLVLWVFGHFIFELIPTCRPYVGYVPDMAFLALTMSLAMACGNFTDYEFACNRFAFLWWSLPLAVLQTLLVVCFSGYTFFYGRLPASVVDWMGSLHIATLRNLIWVMFAFVVIRIVIIAVQLTIRQLRQRSL